MWTLDKLKVSSSTAIYGVAWMAILLQKHDLIATNAHYTLHSLAKIVIYIFNEHWMFVRVDLFRYAPSVPDTWTN